MRGRVAVLYGAVLVDRRERLRLEDVERGLDLSFFQHFEHRVVVNEPASRGVDDKDAGLHHRELFLSDHVLGLRG